MDVLVLLRDNDVTPESFGYDALNRLGSATGLFGQRAYTYDLNGNRTQKSADAAITYAYEAQSNRLATETGWTYTLDANGNTLAKLRPDSTGWTYGYNAHNRLASVTDVATYHYRCQLGDTQVFFDKFPTLR